MFGLLHIFLDVSGAEEGAKNWGNSLKEGKVEYDIDEGWGAAAKVALKTVGKQWQTTSSK